MQTSHKVRCNGVDRHPKTKAGLKHWMKELNSTENVVEVWQQKGNQNCFRLEIVSPLGTLQYHKAKSDVDPK